MGKTDWESVRKRIREEVGTNVKCREPCETCGLGDGIHVAGCPETKPHVMFYVDETPAPEAASG